ncbi:hypothetical protein K7G98_24580, partial [Saccharothrix sp. MB29]|nr:hypothetical protein [Saccharothrix sp. MB29]
LTGVPMILNTSFNLRTKPIVETPGDALNCLFGSRLDRLFIGQYEFTAPNFADMVPSSLTADGDEGPADPREAAILGLVDGSRSVRRIAEEAGLDVEVTIDLVLDMRRREFLDWADLPNRYRELTIPTPQYQPNSARAAERPVPGPRCRADAPPPAGHVRKRRRAAPSRVSGGGVPARPSAVTRGDRQATS